MTQFIFLFRGGAFETPGLSPGEMQAHLKKWHEWSGALMKAGHLSGGQALERRGKTIQGRDRVVTDGPYVESKDLITGSMLINAETLEEATRLAHGCPIFEFGGAVEVRVILVEEQ
jgi:hypothetical protein